MMQILDFAATLAELAWLYLQLYALRTEIQAGEVLRWLAANPDGAIGTACGLAGAFVLAISSKRQALGWLLFLASNVGMIALGLRLQRPDIVILQCGFTITSLLGLWRTGIKPRLSPAVVEPEKPIVPKTHDYPACAIFRGGMCTCD